jgi:hypothetical protein
MMSTLIRVTLKTKERIKKRMKYGDTYDKAFNRVLDIVDECELKEAEK